MNFTFFKEDMISTNFGEAAKEIKRKVVVRNGIGIFEIKTNFRGNVSRRDLEKLRTELVEYKIRYMDVASKKESLLMELVSCKLKLERHKHLKDEIKELRIELETRGSMEVFLEDVSEYQERNVFRPLDDNDANN